MKRLTRPILVVTLLGMLTVPVQRVAAQGQPAPQYTLIVLPTLGGPNNYWENPGPVFNNRGMVALFGSDINAPDPNPNACFNPDCYRDHAAIWQDGTLIDLGAFPGPTSSGLGGISPNGLFATGISTDGSVSPDTGPIFRGALFTHGRVVDLGTLGGLYSGGMDVNDRGQVVGFAENTTPDPHAGDIGGAYNQGAPPVPNEIRAFLWQNGHLQDLGTLGGNDAEAWMINENGQVTGASFTSTATNATTGLPTQHPFLWDRGKMLDLGTLGGTWGLPADLNDAGQVVGSMNLAGDKAHHAFLWKQGKLTDLGTLGGATSDAEWENAAGDVVGRADVRSTGPACSVGGPLGSNKCPHHAVMWKNGKIIDLGTPAGQTCATATSINAADQVVGSTGSCGHGGNGFLWENRKMYLGSDLIPPQPSGLKVEDTFYINDRGEIYGVGALPNGDERAIMLEPAQRNTAAAGDVSSSGTASSASFTVYFDSASPGQGMVLFGSGPGCSGLVETATQDQGAGTTSHMVEVRGNDLPGTVGDIGITPGATYSYETVTMTKSGKEIDNNGGKCYSITIPST
jgi:probable HAF family extracellular repeat protein